MKIPFTIEQFLDVFEHYNKAVWPMQIVLYLFAITGIFFAIKKYHYSDKIISMILSFFWLWMGIVYQLVFFTSINKGAYIFGILFIVQGFLFLWSGFVKSGLTFEFKTDIYGISGGFFLLFALFIYPILGRLLGHIYPHNPTFGAPCPTTIFTFGILLLVNGKTPAYLLIIPLLWSLIGFSAAVNLRIYEDFGLLLAGILGIILILMKSKAIDRNG